MVKDLFKVIIGPLIVAALVLYFGNEKTELSYFLSETIPISVKDSTEGHIQLIEIKNTGKKKVNEIKLKINQDILDYKIIKDSSSDTFKEYTNDGTFEIVYDDLPVSGGFKLTITTGGKIVSQSDIDIRHSEGKALNTLENKDISVETVLFWLLIIIYFLFMLKEMAVSRLESKANLSANEVLEESKPFYCSKKRWNKIRGYSIDNYFKNTFFYEYDSSIRSDPCYIFLDNKKPDYLSEKEWRELTNIAKGKLKEALVRSSIVYYLEDKDILDILRIKRPEYFPQDIWEKIKLELEERYLTLRKKYIRFLKIDELGSINLIKPIEISENIWNEYLRIYHAKYFQEIVYQMIYFDDPTSFLEKCDTSKLNSNENEELVRLAKSLELIKLENIFDPENASRFLKDEKNKMKFREYSTLKITAEKVVYLGDKIEQYKKLLQIARSIIDNGEMLDEKPAEINEDLWHQLKRLHAVVEQVNSRREHFKKVENELEPKMIKVEKQLEIIHNVLVEPNSIRRIEEYNDTFSCGNFENLRKIAALKEKLNKSNH